MTLNIFPTVSNFKVNLLVTCKNHYLSHNKKLGIRATQTRKMRVKPGGFEKFICCQINQILQQIKIKLLKSY